MTQHRKPGRPRTNYGPTSSQAQGYGSDHVKLRARLKPAVNRGIVKCALCGRYIKPFTRWHLAHADDPPGSPPGTAHRQGLYLGAAHAKCDNGTNRRRLANRPAPAKALAFFDTTAEPSNRLPVNELANNGANPPDNTILNLREIL
jgi:hypothetical protein